jgi:hypothetical protein
MSFEGEEKDAELYKKAYALLSELNKRGHETIYISDGQFNDYGYTGIYKEISFCDCLLAFTDRYTFSSTWRTSEITYAMRGLGFFEKADFHIPVFFYIGIDDYTDVFFENAQKEPDVYVLPNNINAAAQSIIATMNEKKKKIYF